MNPEYVQEVWHVDANGEIFETNFAEMTSWIDQGTLLRGDKVRKGHLRWIDAGKVPSLIAVFNAKDNGQPIAPIITTTKLEPSQLPAPIREEVSVAHPVPSAMPADERSCSMHPDIEAFYVCGTCTSLFCKACPTSYGGTVKICPYCGALCDPLHHVVKKNDHELKISNAIAEGFGFGDFARALAHPFHFKTSLILGAVMYTFFSLGQSVVSVGGIFMMGSAVFCFLLANMLSVGILTNTVENFVQGKLDENFMPSFDDFSVWDDVIHPFFLSIGVYLSSFGPFLAVMLLAVFLVMGGIKPGSDDLQTDAARLSVPELPYAADAVKQSERVRELLKKDAEEQKARVAALEDPSAVPGEDPARGAVTDADQVNEARIRDLDNMIREQRAAQIESTIGKSPKTLAAERAEMLNHILGYGALILILGGLTLAWGLFYFPAACAVAGYTRSFTATINPTVGLDTIRRLGSSYILLLVMGLLLLIAASIVSFVLSVVFMPFDLPTVGNIPAKVAGGMFGFYLSVVFSCVIGYALFKASDRLHLVR